MEKVGLPPDLVGVGIDTIVEHRLPPTDPARIVAVIDPVKDGSDVTMTPFVPRKSCK
jgi:hypothetical protein